MPWEDRTSFETQVLSNPGNVYPYDNSGAIAYQTYTEPLRAALTQGAAEDLADYECAIVRVKYATFHLSGTLLISEELSSYFEASPLDYRHLTWASDQKPLTPGHRVGRMECGVNYRLTYHNAVALNVSALTFQNTVNDGNVSMKTLDLTFAADTLLYRSFNVGIGVYSVGVTPIKASYLFTFVYRGGFGWQGLWRADKNPAGYDQVGFQGGAAQNLYTQSTFNF